MKNLVSVFVLSAAVAALVGCNDGSGSKSAPLKDFQASKVPVDAMSEGEIQYFGTKLKAANVNLPSDSLIFNKDVSGTEIRELDYSKERKETNKLSNEGKDLLRKVQSTCQINAPRKNESGTPAQGSTVRTSVVASTNSNCAVYTKIENRMSTHYNQLTQTPDAASVVAEVTTSTSSLRRINDQRTVSLSGTVESLVELAGKGTVSVSATRSERHNTTRISGAGTMSIKFVNGDSLSGTVEFDSLYTDGNTQSNMLMDLKTSRGALRIVLVQASENDKTTYLNGKQVSLEYLKSIGLDFTSDN